MRCFCRVGDEFDGGDYCCAVAFGDCSVFVRVSLVIF